MKYSISDFDFSGKRVRYLGKVLSKFDLSWIIGDINPWSPYHIYPYDYPYADYVSCLKSLLVK